MNRIKLLLNTLKCLHNLVEVMVPLESFQVDQESEIMVFIAWAVSFLHKVYLEEEASGSEDEPSAIQEVSKWKEDKVCSRFCSRNKPQDYW